MPVKFLVKLFAVICIICLVLASVYYIFSVKKIVVKSDSPCVLSEEIEKEVNIKGQFIFLVQKSNLTENLLKKFTCIDQLSLAVKLPSEVEVSYSGKNPVARIDATDILLTAGGLAIKSNTSEILPVIFPPEQFQISEGTNVSDPQVLLALKIINSLSKSDFVATNVRIVNGSITVYNQQDSVVIFSTEKEAESQADSLQKVLAKAKMESKKISKIDMRFDNPIIVFE